MVTLHFKTGTKQTLAVKDIQITESGHGLEKIKLGYLDGQALRFEVSNVAAIFLEEMETE